MCLSIHPCNTDDDDDDVCSKVMRRGNVGMIARCRVILDMET